MQCSATWQWVTRRGSVGRSHCVLRQGHVGTHVGSDGCWPTEPGIVLPGWTCVSCRGFNGEAKERHDACIYCGSERSYGT